MEDVVIEYAEAKGKALIASQDQIDAINALLPAHFRVSGVPGHDGRLQLGADLLSDPENYGDAFEILQALEQVAWTVAA